MAKAAAASAEPAPAVEPTTPEYEAPAAVSRARCVVADGRCVGGPVNGKVCSYHAVSHRPDGSPR